MNLAVGQSINVVTYLENNYEGGLSKEHLHQVESIPWTSWLQNWLRTLSSIIESHSDCELSLRLTSDRQIQQFNFQYRTFDKPTDVLAFAATEAEIALPQDLDEPLYLGDIIISLDTALRQATEQKHSLTVELAWLASHGLLHLLGWDHPDDASLEQMLSQQSALIKLLNIKNAN